MGLSWSPTITGTCFCVTGGVLQERLHDAINCFGACSASFNFFMFQILKPLGTNLKKKQIPSMTRRLFPSRACMVYCLLVCVRMCVSYAFMYVCMYVCRTIHGGLHHWYNSPRRLCFVSFVRCMSLVITQPDLCTLARQGGATTECAHRTVPCHYSSSHIGVRETLMSNVRIRSGKY